MRCLYLLVIGLRSCSGSFFALQGEEIQWNQVKWMMHMSWDWFEVEWTLDKCVEERNLLMFKKALLIRFGLK